MTLNHRAPRHGQSSANPLVGVASLMTDRRRFLGYLIAAPTLAAAAEFGLSAQRPAEAAIPSGPQPPEVYDLNDMLKDAALPTSNLITVTINQDGTASFALPRAEVGQGITTSTAMLVAEELDIPVQMVNVTLADARPELLFNQLTGGSNSTISTFTPIRVAAAIAKKALMQAAAIELGDSVNRLTAKGGVIQAPSGASVTYGELATKAAVQQTHKVAVTLKSASDFTVIGKAQNRVDAREAVTGRKDFTLDLYLPDAMPTMVCRAPTLNGTPRQIRNKATVLAMPGITHVAMVSTGVAVRGITFGQVIDAIRALDVSWNAGTVEGKSDASVLKELKAAELPLALPPLGPLAKTVESSFTFAFRSNGALEPNAAIADVRSDRAEIWSGLKSPIVAQQEIAKMLGLPQSAVKVHVMTSGGSFGRKLFYDAALEAAEISKAVGKPVRLMWHRADDSRVGRTHPMATSRIRASYAAGNVLTFEQRHTSVSTDFTHGLGEIITAMAAKLPAGGNLSFAETIFTLSQEVPYNYGVIDQTLTEVDAGFNTGSMRNIYSPDVCTARELITDQLAKAIGKDPYTFRREFLKTDRVRTVLDKVAEVGKWGRSMPSGMAQGIALHKEYKGVNACLVELDCRPQTVDRKIRDAWTGPRVTKVVMAVDVGLVINPRGLEAQMQGGIMDGIALALTSSLHLLDGYFLEASWDNYYTRQWNTPPEIQVIVMPSDVEEPGGAGEFGVASAYAATACAYARATGTVPTSFPINHNQPIGFVPKSTVPPIPQSPTDGLTHTY